MVEFNRFLSLLSLLFILFDFLTLSFSDYQADNILSKLELPLPNFTFILTRDENSFISDRQFRRSLNQQVYSESELVKPEQTPLFQGMGTHYSFIWVGTPPQRVSVIVDTGSHHTAFPCVGCKCGKHMDPFWDPHKSSSVMIPSCPGGAGNKCFFKQSYSEGSSWHAFKVKDQVWMGGPSINSLPLASQWTVPFSFGCQDQETGLFRTQNVDGIMGLSASPDTLPYTLYANSVTRTRAFSLCFRVGGGVLTLGGVDPRIHSFEEETETLISKPDSRLLFSPSFSLLPKQNSTSILEKRVARRVSPVHWARLLHSSGWFTVRLLDILMTQNPTPSDLRKEKLDPSSPSMKSLGIPASKLNTGKGVIVDSGTTDTYLPASLKVPFSDLFQKIAGIKYSTHPISLSSVQLARLPSLVFRMEGMDGAPIDVVCPPSSYLEPLKGGSGLTRYAIRVYLTEGQGAVLGANFMNNHNVIFDIDNGRVGFARSTCKEDLIESDPSLPSPPVPSITPFPPQHAPESLSPAMGNDSISQLSTYLQQVSVRVESKKIEAEGKPQLWEGCSARCSNRTGSFVARGTQVWRAKTTENNPPFSLSSVFRSRKSQFNFSHEECSILCVNGKETLLGDSGLTPLDPLDPSSTPSRISCLLSDEGWSECSEKCLQTKTLSPLQESVPSLLPEINHIQVCLPSFPALTLTRPCAVYLCPPHTGEFALTLEIKIRFKPRSSEEQQWGWGAHQKEGLIAAFSRVLQIPPSRFHLSSPTLLPETHPHSRPFPLEENEDLSVPVTSSLPAPPSVILSFKMKLRLQASDFFNTSSFSPGEVDTALWVLGSSLSRLSSHRFLPLLLSQELSSGKGALWLESRSIKISPSGGLGRSGLSFLSAPGSSASFVPPLDSSLDSLLLNLPWKLPSPEQNWKSLYVSPPAPSQSRSALSLIKNSWKPILIFSFFVILSMASILLNSSSPNPSLSLSHLKIPIKRKHPSSRP